MADTVYSEKLAEIAGEQAKQGKTNLEIAGVLKIDIKTFYVWQRIHPEFKQAIRDGKDWFDSNVVEKALLEDAIGHEHEEITKELDKTSNELVETKRVRKWERNFPAQRFWLMNRRPDRWRDKHEVEITGKELEDRLVAAEKRLAAIRGDNVQQEALGTTDNS